MKTDTRFQVSTFKSWQRNESLGSLEARFQNNEQKAREIQKFTGSASGKSLSARRAELPGAPESTCCLDFAYQFPYCSLASLSFLCLARSLPLILSLLFFPQRNSKPTPDSRVPSSNLGRKMRVLALWKHFLTIIVKKQGKSEFRPELP
ncbi:Hypothetical_protein [Hexamita inflata]|uniref:Hypothetical_protein n=1 Tax=Hexamita inflata TaxID=28002 RepID=A0AA86TI01_9EUKA|nr:Hypothetical protein HINF_LOCUS1329 [Hexamita inflata]CAI9913693.1 Hypothetical protein HINF_LOCUS1338 [Hexamita inflata]CAI9926405.1 Hypothetical protein HINF_LOCUS14050 [Hexamita inflata]CAI9934190.1 Hypothetical protein HINF_LOCUS21835 [Hexamita inflata]CAI9940630.1 Hypothetical protein HINF_LOCUS28275 [Hexamita inflata]